MNGYFLKDNFHSLKLNGSYWDLPDEGDLVDQTVRGRCTGQYITVHKEGYLEDKNGNIVGFVEHKDTYSKIMGETLKINRVSYIGIGKGVTRSTVPTYCHAVDVSGINDHRPNNTN